MIGEASQVTQYRVPDGILGLKGPGEKPAPGSLPLRGDLAHIALAGQHLAAHYVIPTRAIAGADGVTMLIAPQSEAEAVTDTAPGTPLEVLDTEGDWVWVCAGPAGPSGYCPASALAPSDQES